MSFDDLPERSSRPITIRLNPNNDREARALTVLERYGDNRKAIVDGLLCLDDNDQRLQEIASMQETALSILQKLESGAISVTSSAGPAPNDELTDDFKIGLKKLSRKIQRLDDQ